MAKDKFVPDSFALHLNGYGGLTAIAYDYQYFKNSAVSRSQFVDIVPNRIYTKFCISKYDTSYDFLHVYLPELGVTLPASDYKNILRYSNSQGGVFTGEYTIVRDGRGLYLISIHDPKFANYINVDHNNYNIGDKVLLVDGNTKIYLGTCHRIISNGLRGDTKRLKSKRVHMYVSLNEETYTVVSVKEKCRKVIEPEFLTLDDASEQVERRIKHVCESGRIGEILNKTPFTQDDVWLKLQYCTSGNRNWILTSDDNVYITSAFSNMFETPIIEQRGDYYKIDTSQTKRVRGNIGTAPGGQITQQYTVNHKCVGKIGDFMKAIIEVVVGEPNE